MADLKILVGKRLRQLRKARGLSQSELAFRAEMQDSYLAGFERGSRNISIDSLSRIIEALQAEPVDMFRFGELDMGKGLDSKRDAIHLLAAFLEERSLEEIELIRKMAKDIMCNCQLKIPPHEHLNIPHL